MKIISKRFFISLLFSVSLLQVVAIHPHTEVRAVWLTTIHGLDWPKKGTSSLEQKKQLCAILDTLKNYNFNTVLFQVRTRGEVLYKSKIEPYVFEKKSNNDKREDYDALAFAIEECHKRGLELHAWFVAYPLGDDAQIRKLGRKSVVHTQPSIVKKFNGEWYIDPSNRGGNRYLLSIIDEIVSSYDIDGLHFDYIRYPDKGSEFPDNKSSLKNKSYSGLSDWRRANINRFVFQAYDSIKMKKPWVKVSSASLGCARPRYASDFVWNGFNSVFQDASRWLQEDKHDMIFPMLYYRNDIFTPCAKEWVLKSNSKPVVAGIGAYQLSPNEKNWSIDEIHAQIEYSRKESMSGQAYFRVEHLLKDTKGVLSYLKEVYRYPAKLPPISNASSSISSTPFRLSAEITVNRRIRLTWELLDVNSRNTFTVYRSNSNLCMTNDAKSILATGIRQRVYEFDMPEEDDAFFFFVTVSDAFGVEGAPSDPVFFYNVATEK